ncbi:hypothetical protein J4Q44_G00373570 [Coregonus suidteri]|uniref:Uncharacterized protein n=1 Tax=Coregonus suidteri TaxID=861788 RepID=A0AAN8KHW3_9TELE
MVKKYIVYKYCLLQLFHCCPVCTRTWNITKRFKGTLISTVQIWPHCDHIKTWKSQQYVSDTPAGNLHLTAAIAFTGSSIAQTNKILNALKVQIISESTFYSHQKTVQLPTIYWQWKSEQRVIQQYVREPVDLGGDMTADLPGHCAKCEQRSWQ